MSSVTLQGFILVPEADLSAVKQALKEHIRLTLAEPGCQAFVVEQCTDKPNRFDVYEEFVNMAAFEAHQLRAKRSFWGTVSQNVERHYEVIA